MSGFLRVGCRGAPRDLGFDQGHAHAQDIARIVAEQSGSVLTRWVAALRPPATARAIERDTNRHFPHMAERTVGLARGAHVPPYALALLSAQPERAPADALRIVMSGAGACVARAVPTDTLAILRESAPDTDYRSLELVGLARIAPFVGVNEHGLAVGVVLLGMGSDCAAPASLLAQDCLQRFDRVEKALEWLERRPAGGRARFALADATGAAAAFEIEGAAHKRADASELPLTPPTAALSCVVVADPRARALGWTFADGSTGEASLGERP
jgi:hypothetical protein